MKQKRQPIVSWIIATGIVLILILAVIIPNEPPKQKVQVTCTIPFDIFLSNETYNVSIKDGLCEFTTEIDLEDLE